MLRKLFAEQLIKIQSINHTQIVFLFSLIGVVLFFFGDAFFVGISRAVARTRG